MSESFHIVVNPQGAGGHALETLEKIKPLFEGRDIQVHMTSPSNDTEHICRTLTENIDPEDGDVRIIIIGGDGTMNHAVNGIADFEHTLVALIPAGSANDLIKDMHPGKSSEKDLVQTILRGECVRRVDVGEVFADLSDRRRKSDRLPGGEKSTEAADSVFHRYFTVSAGIGFDAACCVLAERSAIKPLLHKLHLGKLSYLLAAFALIIRNEKARAIITDTDGNKLKLNRLAFAAAMNHRYEGGGFMFAPQAKADDGLLDLCVIHDLNFLSFITLFLAAYDGKHVKKKNKVTMLRAASFRIKAYQPLWVHFDGETQMKAADVTFRMSEHKLRFMA